MSNGQPNGGGSADEYGLTPQYGHGGPAPEFGQPTGPTFIGPQAGHGPQAGQGPQPGQGTQPPYGQQPAPYGQQPAQDQHPYGQQTPYGHQNSYQQYPQYGQGQGAGPAQPKKKSHGLLIGLLSGGLALLLIIIGGAVWAISVRNAPAKALEEFFDAVVAADAQAAINLLETAPSDTSLITDEVLRRSQELAPFTDVKVRPGSSSVRVELKIGGKQEVEYIDMVKSDDGWRVSDFPREVSVAGSVLGKINGAKPVDPTTLTLLPGTYELDDPSPNLEYRTKEKTFTVLSYGIGPNTSLSVTQSGKDATVKAIQDYFTNCAKSTDAQPKGCPYQLRPVYPVVGKYTWSHPKAPQVRVRDSNVDSSGVLRQSVSYDVRLQYRYRYGGSTQSYDRVSHFTTTLKVNLLGEKPVVSL
ncbi:hypothetical protein ACQCX2_12525 [Propionibacteriaceae bacterium Y1700]|uniref:hypothetical protein n=1 Tax=Microlunatus sp. Y1700 TaxID=3418487 RepID=UPI003DA76A49